MSDISITSLAGDSIHMEVIGRTYPQQNDRWDGNWLNTKIKLQSGEFSGTTNALLRSDELELLSKDIDGLIRSEKDALIFSPMEPWITFRMVENEQRNIELNGEVKDKLGTGNIRKFNFDCSRSILEEMLAGINSVLKEFPVKR